MISNGDVLTINNNKYLVLESARYEEVDYIFTNKLDKDENTSEEYFVMKKNNGGVLFVTDKKILDIILPVFSNKIQKDIEKYNEENKFEI